MSTPTIPAMTLSQARTIARELLVEHGLSDWSVTFNNARRAAGHCNYGKRVIVLSRFVFAQRSYADNLNTITHEVAHALTRGHKHDRIWARKHRELGGDGQRCCTAELTDDSAPWVAECEHGVIFRRYRAPKPGSRFRCRCRPAGAPVVFQRRTR